VGSGFLLAGFRVLGLRDGTSLLLLALRVLGGISGLEGEGR